MIEEKDKKNVVDNGIRRTKIIKGVNGMTLEHTELVVYGEDLSECQRVFNEQWKADE